MRIPQILDFNTFEEYRPPTEPPKLWKEVGKNVIASDFNWNNNIPSNLSTLCLRILAEHFQERPILLKLTPHDQDHILELISTELDLQIAVPLIEAEYYWRRRYQKHFGENPMHCHLGWTWKCVYLEHHIRKLIEEAQPQYVDEVAMQPVIELCHDYIHILHITQLQNWEHPKTLLPSERPKMLKTAHINFINILQYLPYLTFLEISYGKNNIGVDYEKKYFELSVDDCDKLGSGILHLKHLKTFRLNKSEVEGNHVKALIKHLIYNVSIEELDLSHCKIGDIGANCLGMMLTINEKLEILKIKNNNIGPDGIMGIAWAFQVPQGSQLKVLDVSLNPIKYDGCARLLTILLHGSVPHDVSIGHCSIPSSTAILIATMIRRNTSLKNLDISGNIFGEEGVKILEALKENHHLLSLDIRDTQIPVKVKEKIQDYLKRNYDAIPIFMRHTSSFLYKKPFQIKISPEITSQYSFEGGYSEQNSSIFSNVPNYVTF